MVSIRKEASGADDLQAVAGEGPIDGERVLRLRRAIYRDGGIDRENAAALFRLNRDHRSHDSSWSEFYVEALTDFFYWREGSDSALTEEAEQMLMTWIGPSDEVDDGTELRLLLSLVFRTNGCSEAFRSYVLDAVRHSVLHSSQGLYGDAARMPGAIDAADVEIIRKLVYGLGGERGMAIGRTEAQFLFELDRATAGAANVPAWQELFVKAIAMYLLFAGPSPDSVDDQEAQWLVEQIDACAGDLGNVRALLAYLRDEGGLHPLIDELCERVGT